jgi:hypothetical protein
MATFLGSLGRTLWVAQTSELRWDVGAPWSMSLSEKALVEEILVKHTFTCEKHKF